MERYAEMHGVSFLAYRTNVRKKYNFFNRKTFILKEEKIMKFKVVYYREEADVTDVRYFSSLEEFDEWLDRASKIEVIEIKGFEII